MARCNKCKGCTTPECSVCSNCRSMKKFGGNGTIKKACLLVVLSLTYKIVISNDSLSTFSSQLPT